MNTKYILSNMDLAVFPKLFKEMTAIYLWTNLINGKRYVGSSFNLERRVSEYLNPDRLVRELDRGESIIYKAILKHGYLSFSFQVLEVVELDSFLSDKQRKLLLLSREQKYLDELKPEYNILKQTGTNFGHKMSDEARLKISMAKKGKPSHRKGAVLTDATRSLIKSNSNMSKKTYVYSPDNVLIDWYPSMTDCALFLGISRHQIGRALDKNKLVNGKYIFKSTNPLFVH